MNFEEYYNKAIIYLEANDYYNAFTYFKKSIELSPDEEHKKKCADKISDFFDKLLNKADESNKRIIYDYVNTIDKNLLDYSKKDLYQFTIYYEHHIRKPDFWDIFENLYKTKKNEINKRIRTIFKDFQASKEINKFFQQIFKIELEINKNDKKEQIKSKLDNYYKIQFKGMLYVFNEIFDEIVKYKKIDNFCNRENFHGLFRYYKYLLINIDMILYDAEIKNNINNNSQIESDNRIKSSDVFASSKRLKLYLSSTNELSSFNTSVFLIRQSIELKIKNSLGIDYILNDFGLMEKIPGDNLINFVYNNKNISFSIINKSIIKKIHKWTNYFIHGGFIIYIWQIHIAHKILEKLFTYDSITIEKDYYNNNLKIELENYIKKNCNRNNNLNNMQIKYLDKPEAHLI